MKVNVYLNFAGNAEEAFSLYRSAFGGEIQSLVRYKDMPMPGMTVPKADENKVMHIALPVGNDILMGSDTLESMGQALVQGNNAYVSVHPDSKEQADRMFNALSSGGNVEMAMADQPWGDYYGSFRDRFGIMWMIDYGYPKQQAGAAEPFSAGARAS